jgi:hypothetical protein
MRQNATRQPYLTNPIDQDAEEAERRGEDVSMPMKRNDDPKEK